jgi:cystathionine beta-lyase family protein involved in aluminum resistance
MTNRIRLALHDQPAPWDMPGYNDHVDAWGADQREA